MTFLDAGYVHSGADGGIVTVGFADHKYGTRRYVLLQRGILGAIDARGHNQVHITVEDEGRSTYGGIRRLQFGSSEVRIKLEPHVASQLGTDEEIVIRLPPLVSQREELTARLRELFANEPDVLCLR